MSEPKIARVLAASLHQAITELLPTRVEFYETWLAPLRIKQGKLGRARIAAVISFLRQEGADYDAVVARAGRYAADWTVDALLPVTRTIVCRLPRPIRMRMALRLAARLIEGCHDDVRVRSLVRRGTAVVTIDGSLFCDVRDLADDPLCRFYGATLERCLGAFSIPSRVELSRCRGLGHEACELIVKTAVADGGVT